MTYQHRGVLSGFQHGEVGVFGFPHLGLDANADCLPRFIRVANDAVRRGTASTIGRMMLVPLQQKPKNDFPEAGVGCRAVAC